MCRRQARWLCRPLLLCTQSLGELAVMCLASTLRPGMLYVYMKRVCVCVCVRARACVYTHIRMSLVITEPLRVRSRHSAASCPPS